MNTFDSFLKNSEKYLYGTPRRRTVFFKVIVTFTAVNMLFMGMPVWALPTGAGTLVDATTLNAGSGTLNWSSYKVAGGETVNYDGDSINVVNGGGGTDIQGTINAAGFKFWIFDPAGISIGSGATLNIGSLLAAAMNFGDWNNGNFTAGKVTGNVSSSVSGILIGQEVAGSGTIVATKGMDAGSTIIVDPSGGKITFGGTTGAGSVLDAGDSGEVNFNDGTTVAGGKVNAKDIKSSTSFQQSGGEITAAKVSANVTQSGGTLKTTEIGGALNQTAAAGTVDANGGTLKIGSGSTVAGTITASKIDAGTGTLNWNKNAIGTELNAGSLNVQQEAAVSANITANSITGSKITQNSGTINTTSIGNEIDQKSGATINAGSSTLAVGSGSTIAGTITASKIDAGTGTLNWNKDAIGTELKAGSLNVQQEAAVSANITASSITGSKITQNSGTINATSIGNEIVQNAGGTITSKSGTSLSALTLSGGMGTQAGKIETSSLTLSGTDKSYVLAGANTINAIQTDGGVNAVTVNSALTSSGNVNLKAATLGLNAVVSGANVTLEQTSGNYTLKNVSTTGNLTAKASAGELTVDQEVSAKNITLDANSKLNLDQSITTTGTGTGDYGLQMKANDAITQSAGSITVANGKSMSVSVADGKAVTLGGQNSLGTVKVVGKTDKAGDVTINDVRTAAGTATALNLDEIKAANLTVTAKGNVTQSAAATVTTKTTVTANDGTADKNITLNNVGNSLGTDGAKLTGKDINVKTSGSISLNSSTGVNASGNLDVDAASLTVNDITGDWNKEVVLKSSTTGLELKNIEAKTLSVTAAGDVTQYGTTSVKVTDATDVTAQDITLANDGNEFGSFSATGAKVTIKDDDVASGADSHTGNGLVLNNINASELEVTAKGDVTQQKYTAEEKATDPTKVDSVLNISGAMSVTAIDGTTDKDITLDNANSFGGDVTLNGANVNVYDTTALSLANVTANGNLTAKSGGTLTLGKAITAVNDGNGVPLNEVSLETTADGLTIDRSITAKKLTITAAGDVSQDAATIIKTDNPTANDVVKSGTTVTVATGSDVTLNGQNKFGLIAVNGKNDNKGEATSAGAVTITDSGNLIKIDNTKADSFKLTADGDVYTAYFNDKSSYITTKADKGGTSVITKENANVSIAGNFGIVSVTGKDGKQVGTASISDRNAENGLAVGNINSKSLTLFSKGGITQEEDKSITTENMCVSAGAVNENSGKFEGKDIVLANPGNKFGKVGFNGNNTRGANLTIKDDNDSGLLLDNMDIQENLLVLAKGDVTVDATKMQGNKIVSAGENMVIKGKNVTVKNAELKANTGIGIEATGDKDAGNGKISISGTSANKAKLNAEQVVLKAPGVLTIGENVEAGSLAVSTDSDASKIAGGVTEELKAFGAGSSLVDLTKEVTIDKLIYRGNAGDGAVVNFSGSRISFENDGGSVTINAVGNNGVTVFDASGGKQGEDDTVAVQVSGPESMTEDARTVSVGGKLPYGLIADGDGKNVTLNYSGALTVDEGAQVKADGDVTIKAFNGTETVTIDGNATAPAAGTTIENNGTIAAVKGNASLTGTAIQNNGTITAGNDLALTATATGGNIKDKTGSTITAKNGDTTLSAGGYISLISANNDFSTIVSATAKGVAVNDMNALKVTTAEATKGDLDFTAGGSFESTGALTATAGETGMGLVSVGANKGTPADTSDEAKDAAAGNVTLGGKVTGNAVNVNAAGSVNVNNAVVATETDVNIKAADSVTTKSGAGSVSANGNASVTAKSGTATLNDAVSGKNVTVTAGGAVSTATVTANGGNVVAKGASFANSGEIDAADGNILVKTTDAAGTATIGAAVNAKNVTIDAAGAVTENAVVNATADKVVTAGGNITVNKDSTADTAIYESTDGKVAFTTGTGSQNDKKYTSLGVKSATGIDSLNFVVVSDNLVLDAGAGNVKIGGTDANVAKDMLYVQNVALKGNNVTVGENGSASATDVKFSNVSIKADTVNATGAVTADGKTLSVNGVEATDTATVEAKTVEASNVTAGAGGATVTATAGDATVANVTTVNGGAATVTADNGTANVGNVNASGAATVDAANVNATGTIAGNGVTVTADNAANVANVNAGAGKATINGDTVTAANGTTISGNEVEVTADDTANVANVTAGAGGATVTAANGNANVANVTTANGGAATVTADNGTANVGNVNASGAATVDAANVNGTGTIAGNGVTVTADNAANVNNVNATAGAATVDGANVNATGLVQGNTVGVTATTGNANVNNVNATAGGATVTAANGDVNVGNVTANGNTTLNAGNAVAATGTVTANGGVNQVNAATVTQGTFNGGTVDINTPGGQANLTAVNANGEANIEAANTTGGQIAGGTVTINTPGNVANDIQAGGQATIQSGSINNNNINAGGLELTTGDVTTGAINVGGQATFNTGAITANDINVGNAVFNSGAINAPQITVGGAATGNAGDLNFNQFTAGSIDMDTGAVAGGGTITTDDIALRSGGNVDIVLDMGNGGQLRQLTGNTIDLTIPLNNGVINLGEVAAGGNLVINAPNIGNGTNNGGGFNDANGGANNLTGDNITLNVGGRVGTLQDPIEVQVNGGTITVNGGDASDVSFVHLSLAGADDIQFEGDMSYGLVILNNQVVGGNPKLIRAMNRAFAFTVNTPELKSAQGIFGSPAFLHTMMDVSVTRSMGMLDMLSLGKVDFGAPFERVLDAAAFGDLSWDPPLDFSKESELTKKIEALEASSVVDQKDIRRLLSSEQKEQLNNAASANE